MFTPFCRPRPAPRGVIAAMVLALSLPASSTAIAHDNAYLATIRGDHGGLVRMADMYHFELLMKDGVARVWVTDHGNTAIASAGAAGSLRVFTGSGGFTVDLRPIGGNELIGNELIGNDVRIRPVPDMKLQLNITMPGGKPLLSRYVLGAEAPTVGDAAQPQHRH